MSNLPKRLALILILLAAAGTATAEEQKYVCAPQAGNSEPAYQIICPLKDGQIDENSCQCRDQFVLVNTDAAPASTAVPANPSGG